MTQGTPCPLRGCDREAGGQRGAAERRPRAAAPVEAAGRGGRGGPSSTPGFYDTIVEQWCRKPLQSKPVLRAMVHRGTADITPTERIIESAQFVQAELPKRLARWLMDLQFLPHIKRIHDAYYHAFLGLIKPPLVDTVSG